MMPAMSAKDFCWRDVADIDREVNRYTAAAIWLKVLLGSYGFWLYPGSQSPGTLEYDSVFRLVWIPPRGLLFVSESHRQQTPNFTAL
jgi:hypothetical protein